MAAQPLLVHLRGLDADVLVRETRIHTTNIKSETTEYISNIRGVYSEATRRTRAFSKMATHSLFATTHEHVLVNRLRRCVREYEGIQ